MSNSESGHKAIEGISSAEAYMVGYKKAYLNGHDEGFKTGFGAGRKALLKSVATGLAFCVVILSCGIVIT